MSSMHCPCRHIWACARSVSSQCGALRVKKYLTAVKAICSHIKVAELNTLSVGKGITGIPSTCFIETENTNENTNSRELADVKEAVPSGTSQQKCCQCHSNHR